MSSERVSVRADLRRKFQSLSGVGPATATKCADAAMEYLDILVQQSEPSESDDPCRAFPWHLFDAAGGQRVEEVEITEDDDYYVFIVVTPGSGGHCCGDSSCEDNGVDYNKIPARFKTPEFDGVRLVRPSDV